MLVHEDIEKRQRLLRQKASGAAGSSKRHISPIPSAINQDPKAGEAAEEFGRTILAADAFDDQA